MGRIRAGIFGILALMLAFTAVPVGAQESFRNMDEFAGNRITICRISNSDLENFVSGGRTTLEMMISQNQQDWFTCSTKSQGRNLYLILRFSFDSYIDYEEKLTVLLGEKPITTYSVTETDYIENFLPSELFGFIGRAMNQKELTEEQDFSGFLQVHSDKIILNGEEFSNSGAFNTAEEDVFSCDNIEINTVLDQDGAWTRTIEIRPTEEMAASALSAVEERSKACGATYESDSGSCTVNFTATTEEELVRNTMIVLRTSVNISHRKYYKDESTVRMETEESIDVEPLLTEEGGFRYRLELTDDYENLAAVQEISEEDDDTYDNGLVNVSGNTVSCDEKNGNVRFYYDEAVMFDSIQIWTDLSDELKKIKRSILFCMNGEIADEYHEMIKEDLSSRLQDGDSLRIYDDQGNRYYEVSFQSWFPEDVEHYTERILGVKSCNFEVDRKALPIFESTVAEQLLLENSDIHVYSGETELNYILPYNAGTSELEEGSNILKYTCSDEGKYSEQISFRCFHYKKLLLYIFAVCFSVSLITLGAWKVKNRLKKGNRKRQGEKEISEPERRLHGKNRKTQHNQEILYNTTFCPKCGNMHKPGEKFCGRCGYRFKD